MKTLILAGGLGTRLRPLSCTRPKLLFPIANRPIIDLILERLGACGVKEVVLAVNFLADVLEQTCGKSKYGMQLHYSRDKLLDSERTYSPEKALGTGGPVKQAEELLGRDAPFFVLNGDILTDADYLEILNAHKNNNSIATIALRRVADPSRYGTVEITKENRIRKFVEKPIRDAPSNLINAGVYVFEPEIFNFIPTGKRCSIEKDVFPNLATEGLLFGHEITDLWVDIGKPADLIEANRLWLEAHEEAARHLVDTKVDRNVEIKNKVSIGNGVAIGGDSVIGPNVSLGKSVHVGEGVHIKDSIVFPSTYISDLATIEGAIIGEFVRLGKKARIRRGCLIGDNVKIKSHVSLSQNVKVCPSKIISESVPSSECIM